MKVAAVLEINSTDGLLERDVEFRLMNYLDETRLSYWDASLQRVVEFQIRVQTMDATH